MDKGKIQHNRRNFIKGSGVYLGFSALGMSAPEILIKKDYTIRVLGTHVTLQEELRQQAMKDLGINIIFEPGGSAEVLHKASTRPKSFDLYEQWSNSIKILWQAGAIQAIDTKRIKHWESVNSLTKSGKLTKQASLGKGDVPYKLLWAQKDGSIGENPTSKISFLPYVHNTDSIGYNSNIIPKGIPYKTETWAWLLDEKYRGKVAIVNAPTIGIFDLALAAQAKGLVHQRLL